MAAEPVEINRERIQSLLTPTDLAVVFAKDGYETIEYVSSEKGVFDLILMDMRMPRLDGRETTERIRASGLPGAESVPIIAFTADIFGEDQDHYFAYGINGHIRKPVNPDELIGILSNYVTV